MVLPTAGYTNGNNQIIPPLSGNAHHGDNTSNGIAYIFIIYPFNSTYLVDRVAARGIDAAQEKEVNVEVVVASVLRAAQKEQAVIEVLVHQEGTVGVVVRGEEQLGLEMEENVEVVVASVLRAAQEEQAVPIEVLVQEGTVGVVRGEEQLGLEMEVNVEVVVASVFRAAQKEKEPKESKAPKGGSMSGSMTCTTLCGPSPNGTSTPC